MNPGKPLPPGSAKEEVSALIETLHQTDERLEQLTAGEVDAVVDRRGRTSLLRRAQDHLHDREAAILNTLPANIAVLDTQGRIILVNEAWRQFSGSNALQSPGYGIGVNYLEICDGARGDDAFDAQRAAAGIRTVLDGAAKNFSMEYPCHSPTEQRWFLMMVTPLAGDPPNGAVVMHLNITGRKQAEDKLRESENLLQLVVENVPLRIFWKDRDLRYLGCNTRFAKDAGHSSPSELTGKTDFVMGWKDQAELYRADDKEVLDSGAPKLDIEEPQTTPDGNTIWLRTSKVPLRDKDNQIIGVLGAYQDITERKQAEEDIRFKNTMLLTQQEVSPDAILMVDENSQIISYNQQFIELWRLPPQLVSARLDAPVLKAVVEQAENSEAFVARVQYLYAHRDDKSREEIPLKDGRIIDRHSAPMTGAGGHYYGRVWYFRDITERKRAENALRESERRFSDLLENVELVSMMLDREARIIYCNDYLLRLTGWQQEEVIGQNWFALFVPPEINDLKEGFFAALLANRPEALHHENEILTRSGERRLIRWNNSVLRSAAGDVIGIASIGEDITERKKAEARIIYLNRVLAVLSGINTLIVRINNRDELFRDACRVAVETGGFRMAMLAIVDRSTMKIVPVTSAGKDEELMTAIKDLLSSSEDAPKTMVARAIREKTAVVSNDALNDPRVLLDKQYVESGVRSLAIFPLIIANEAVGAITLYASEIGFFHEEEMKLLTELAGDIAFAIDHIDKQERLDYLAYYDTLTGLANRSLFLERVALYMRSAISSGHKLSIGLIDLERFKNINDSLGRAAGDALLKQVAQWMTHKVGDANLLARIDADHFAVVLPEVRSDGNLAGLVENLLTSFMKHPFKLNDTTLRISIKVGVVVFPDDGDDADTLFKHAEAALKKAKASGDRYLFYTQKMMAAVADKLTLENQLRQAIDNQEFILHYQPKVNLASGKVTSAEALIRWNDPRTGLVPPGKFIPILEETGLIHEVGRWALRQAIADYLRWRAAGLPAVRIAVNVSPLQLHNPGFIAEIEQAIAIDTHVAAGLELEITESLIMDDVERNIITLNAIRAMGITIAIDDFGTGFSSLNYLAKLPVDTLKIDRSFVIEMNAPEGLALVSTIIIVAHALKLKTVAEGVETEEQASQLRSLNCDEMQGYLFSKPVPGEIFEAKFLAPVSPGDKQS